MTVLAGCDTYLIAPSTVDQLATVPPPSQSRVSLAARRESDGKRVHVRNDLITLDETPLPSAYRARVTRLDSYGIAAIVMSAVSVPNLIGGAVGLAKAEADLQAYRQQPCSLLCGLGQLEIDARRAAGGAAVGVGLLTAIMTVSFGATSAGRAESKDDRARIYLGQVE